jgi:hypothetical protein
MQALKVTLRNTPRMIFLEAIMAYLLPHIL